jgi:hypothetical protein
VVKQRWCSFLKAALASVFAACADLSVELKLPAPDAAQFE